MRTIAILLLASANLWATSKLTVDKVTATAIIYRLDTDQVGSCVVKSTDTYVPGVHDFTTAYLPLPDVDATLFAGRDACGRAWNQDNGAVKYLRVGFRASLTSSTDNRRKSLAAPADTRIVTQVTVGSDTVVSYGSTSNIPLGTTFQPPRFDPARPGEYNYPTFDFSDKSKKVVDPMTGLKVGLMALPASVLPTVTPGIVFNSPLTQSGSGWTITGLGAVYSGTDQSKLYLRTTNPGFGTVTQTFLYAQLLATLSGSVTQSVDACLTANGVTCAGATITSVALTGSPTALMFGSTVPILESWRNAPTPPLNGFDVTQFDAFVDVAMDKITVTRNAVGYTDYFSPRWTAGTIVRINGIDCAIGSYVDEKTLVLASNTCLPSALTGATLIANTFGFLIWAHTNANTTITLATGPTWTMGVGQPVSEYSEGSVKQCNPAEYIPPAGIYAGMRGHLCESVGIIFWLSNDGTVVSTIGSKDANPTGAVTNQGCAYTFFAPDATRGDSYWCRFNTSTGHRIARNVYSGNALDTVVTSAILPNSAIQDIPAVDLEDAVTTFNSEFSGAQKTACGGGFGIQGIQGNELIIVCGSQDLPAWIIAYNVSSGTVVAAANTWSGAAMSNRRWLGVHTAIQTVPGYFMFTFNRDGPSYRSTLTSGSLGPNSGGTAWINCGVNTVDPPLSGQLKCTDIVISSMTPLKAGSSLFAETWKLGDYAAVTDNLGQKEQVRIITNTSGSNIRVQRNVNTVWATDHGSCCNTDHTATGTVELQTFPSAIGSFEWWWHYAQGGASQGADVADATMPCGRSMCPDPISNDCHQVYNDVVAILACILNVTGDKNGYKFRTSGTPGGFSQTSFSQLGYFNFDGKFAGTTFDTNHILLETHPSMNVQSPAVDAIMGMDARPFLNTSLATGADVSKVGGATYIWKIRAAGTSELDYRRVPIGASSGDYILADVSPAVLADTVGDNYKYCYVVIANDCRSGSVAGEMYFNLPFVTVPNAYNAWSNMVGGDVKAARQRDISIFPLLGLLSARYQFDLTQFDPIGRTQRVITTGFSRLHTDDVYANVRQTTGGRLTFWGTNLINDAFTGLLYGPIPPRPPVDSISRNNYVPISVKLTPPAGQPKVRARFGYAEFGLGATSPGYCGPRQVACTTSASTALPYVWIDEPSPTVQDCAGGCIVSIPALPGYVLYYAIDWSADGITWSLGSTMKPEAVQ